MTEIETLEFERLEPRRFYDRDLGRDEYGCPERRRCAVCRCDPKSEWSTPIVREDDRTGIGVPIDIIHTCSSWYCRERARYLAEIYPSIEMAPRCAPPRSEGIDILYPASIRYLESI